MLTPSKASLLFLLLGIGGGVGIAAAVIRALLLATRPKTLPAAVVPVWVGCVLAWKLSGDWSPKLAAATLLGAVFIQIATNFFNDAIDAAKGADTEKRIGPKRVTASGMLSRRAVMMGGLVFLLLAVLCGVILIQAAGWPILAIGIPSMYLAFGYTGGPFPLAYRGMGELFVVLFFGVVAVCGTVYVQMLEWRPEAVLLGLQIGLLSAVLISINNLRDREEDATTGKRTLAVRWGGRAARILIWFEVKAAAILGLGWIYFGEPWLVLGTLPLWLAGFRIIWGVLTEPEGPRMNRLLAIAAVQLVAFAGMFHLFAMKF